MRARSENPQVQAFFARYPHKRFRKGQTLIYGGDDPAHIFYLAKGTVRQYDISGTGDEIVVNVFKPYAFFPMSWAINRQHNPYFFEAETDIELYIAPPDDVVAFLKSHPDIMYDLLSRLYSGIDGLQRRMAHLMGGTAETRLIFELTVQYKRFGKITNDGGMSLTITESALAERTGLSRETVSREMSKLIKRQLVVRRGRKISIQNIGILEGALGDNL